MAEGGFELQEFDTRSAYENIDAIQELQARALEEYQTVQADASLNDLRIQMTNEDINVLKNLITKETSNINTDLLKIKLQELRPRLLRKSKMLYLISDKNNAKVESIIVMGKTYRAVRISSKDGAQLLSVGTLKSALGVKDPLIELLENKASGLSPSGGEALPFQGRDLEASGLEAETSFINPVEQEINPEPDRQVESTETLIKRLADARSGFRSTLIDATAAIRTARTIEEIVRPLEQADELSKVLTAEDRQLITKYLDFVKENYNKKNELISDIERNKKIITEAERKLQIERTKSSIEENNIDELEKQISDAKANIQTSKQMLDQILAYNERIYEDVSTRLQSKFTLGQKLAYIFRKYGITVFALITAIGTVITTVLTALGFSAVNNVIGGGAGGVIKKALQSFANWLLEIAKKAASNLPSIIGTIVSVLISIIASIIGFVAENLIVLVIAVSFALFEAIKSAYKRSKK